jgi:hypothetical protein
MVDFPYLLLVFWRLLNIFIDITSPTSPKISPANRSPFSTCAVCQEVALARGKTALVTGAAGFIGSHVARQLRELVSGLMVGHSRHPERESFLLDLEFFCFGNGG